jgi:TolA-binding protein
MADLMLRSKRSDRDAAARTLYGEVVTRFPKDPRAPEALARKAALEERAQLRVFDPVFQRTVPAALISYRTLVNQYPGTAFTEAAYGQLIDSYLDLHWYESAARAREDLAARHPRNRRDAAWEAGKIYEDEIKDRIRARAAYTAVPPTSPHYQDAQKKLR